MISDRGGLALGIDVGGTASRWVLLDAEGAVVDRGAAPGGTGHIFKPDQREIFIAVMQAIAQGVAGRPVAALNAGITGWGDGVDADGRAILSGLFGVPGEAMTLTDDMELAYASVFGPGSGHLVIAGTGSVGMHRRADGSTVRVGGRGILIDDAGSGSWVTLTAIDRLYRILDAHGAPVGAEVFAEILYAAAGGREWDDVRRFVYGIDRGQIGINARLVAAAADRGDPLALGVLVDAGRELARLAEAMVMRAGLLPVAVIGGTTRLHASLRETMIAALPGVAVSFPDADAALSAARLALRQKTSAI